jgi:hypothetical protein
MNYSDIQKASSILTRKGLAPIEMILVHPDDFDDLISRLTEDKTNCPIIIPYCVEYNEDGDPVDMIDDEYRYAIVDFVMGLASETKLTITDGIEPGKAILIDASAPMFNFKKPEIKLERDWEPFSCMHLFGLNLTRK